MMNTNTVLHRTDAKISDAPTPEFDPYRNEDTLPADAKTFADVPEADGDDSLDMGRNLTPDAGMRDGGMTGSIEEDR